MPPRDAWLEASITAGDSTYLDRIHRWARVRLDAPAFITFCVYIFVALPFEWRIYGYVFFGLLGLFIIDTFYSPWNYRRLTRQARRFLRQAWSAEAHSPELLRAAWLELNQCGARYSLLGSGEVITFALVNGMIIGWLFSWRSLPILLAAAIIASVIAALTYLMYFDWAFYPLKARLCEYGLVADERLIPHTRYMFQTKVALFFGMASGSTLIFLATLGYTRAVALGARSIPFLIELGSVVLISTFLLMAFAVLLAQNLTMSVQDLDNAIKRLTQGDFSVQAPIVSASELGRICMGFNDMVMRLEQANVQKQRFHQRLAQAQEAEKNRIAREIHDATMNEITVLQQEFELLTMGLSDVNSLEDVLSELPGRLREINQGLRQACFDLASERIVSQGLQRALQEWVEHLRQEQARGVEIQLRMAAHATPSLREEAASLPFFVGEDAVLNVYRCIQQAVVNALRHARANRIDVILGGDLRVFEAQVRVNGTGFDLEAALALRDEGRLGIQCMYGRMALIGGELHIDTAPGRGTTILIRVPVNHKGAPVT